MDFGDILSKRNKPLPDVFTYDEVPLKLRIQFGNVAKMAFANQDARDRGKIYHHLLFTMSRHHGLDFGDVTFDMLPEQTFFSCLKGLGTTELLDLMEETTRLICYHTYNNYNGSKTEAERLTETLVKEINYRFLENGVGYEFSIEAQRLFRIDNMLLHTEAVKPALHLLSDSVFAVANKEYLDAFEDYRHHRYADALTKCVSAFESFLKVICDQRGWTHDPKAAVGALLDLVVDKAALEPSFKQCLLAAPIFRNRKSSAHGGGKEARNAEPHVVRFGLHSIASAMLLIYDQVKALKVNP